MSVRLRDALTDMIAVFGADIAEMVIPIPRSDKIGMRCIAGCLFESKDEIHSDSEICGAEITTRPDVLLAIYPDRNN
jgi:hypothetical protein